MTKMLDCGLEVSEFELQSPYYFQSYIQQFNIIIDEVNFNT